MTERTITALYDTRGAAETARDGLVALGVPSHQVAIRGTGEGAAGATTGEEDGGFWASLSDLFMPDEDRSTYAEGLRRGGYLLTAHVPDDLEDQALEVLERSDPVDLDQRAESWRQEGWTGYQAGATSTDAGAATAGAAVSGAERAAPARPRRRGLGAATGLTATNAAGEEVIQAAEEQLRVGKREVGRGGVRVRSYVTERPVEEQVELRQERVTVERRPVDRELAPGRGRLPGAHDRGGRARRGGGGLQDGAGDRGDRPAQGRRARDRDGARHRAQAGGRGRGRACCR